MTEYTKFPTSTWWSRVSELVQHMKLESSGMWHRVVTLKLTDVSEVRTDTIIIIIALMMEAVRTSEGTVNFNVDYTELQPRIF
jgi:hypothetical protein